MKLYETNRWDNVIVEREFAKVTEHFAIKDNGQRIGLSTEWSHLFPTRDEAVKWKHSELKGKLEYAESALASARDKLTSFRQQEGL